MLWMTFGIFCMSLSSMCIKITDEYTHQSTLMVFFWRTSFMVIGSFLYAYFIDNLNPFSIRDQQLIYLLIQRGAWGSISYSLEVLSIFLMPISMSVVLLQTQPIFSSLLSHFIMGERVSKLTILTIISSTFGVIMIANPQLIINLFGIKLD